MNTKRKVETKADLAWWLECYLNDADGWVTRSELRDALGFSDREIRWARDEAGGDVISCTKGFKATHNATNQEVRESLNMNRQLCDAAYVTMKLREKELQKRAKVQAASDALQRGESDVDVWAAVNGKDAA